MRHSNDWKGPVRCGGPSRHHGAARYHSVGMQLEWKVSDVVDSGVKFLGSREPLASRSTTLKYNRCY